MFRFLVFVLCLSSFFSFAQRNKTYYKSRALIVEQQIKARGISNKAVLDAYLKVPRHKFVLLKYQQYAYANTPFPIGEGQTISQPYIVAFVADALQLKKEDKVLEIGTGSGYQAAILAEICDSVYTIEIFENLGKKASGVFKELNNNNIFAKIGDSYKGWPKHALFDAIIVTCAPAHVPKPIKELLAEGGKMIIPVGSSGNQKLILLEKRKGKLKQKNVLPVRFVPMINTEKGTY